MARRIHCGINTDPKNPYGNPSVQQLRDLGATWVRFTFKDDVDAPQPTRFADYDSLVGGLQQAGVKTLMILSYETYPGKPAHDASVDTWNAYIAKFAARCGQIAQHYGSQVAAYEVWNEPDHAEGAYDPRAPAEAFGRLLKAAYSAIKQSSAATVVMGGLASGQPPYIAQARAATGGQLYVDAVGVHPYFRRPTADWPPPDPAGQPWGVGVLADLIVAYHDVAQKPIWITEIGIDAADNAFQREFLRRSFEALDATVYEIAPYVFWYCWSEGMGPRFGLVNLDGTRKPAYDAFRQFAKEELVTISAAVAGTLLQKAQNQQRIQFNPGAALQQRIFAHGFVPNSPEFEMPFGAGMYLAQRAEHLKSGEVRVYYAQKPFWDKVWFISASGPGPQPVDSPSAHSSPRQGESPRYIVVHSSQSPVGVPAQDRVTYLVGPNEQQTSVHEVVLPSGQVFRLVADGLAAHHCISPDVRLPDGTSGQPANLATWGIEAYQIVGRAVGQEVLETTKERVAAACRRLSLDHTQVLGYSEVDPGVASNPAGVDMEVFRAGIADCLLQAELVAQAQAHQVIQFNPTAALQERIFAHDFVPNSGEFDMAVGNAVYRAQRAEHLQSGEVRVYYVRVPHWSNVEFISRP